LILNDVVIYDLFHKKITDHYMHNESNVASRIYSCGFKIDNKIFAVGGLTLTGKLLDSVV
jgi:hypothetical protein